MLTDGADEMSSWIFVVLITEYILCSGGMIDFGNGGIGLNTWIMLLVGYVLLTRFITCNNHGRGVRVRYEQELSFALKDVACNFVMLVFLVAVADISELPVFGHSGMLEGIVLTTLVQLISIMVICRILKKSAERKVLKRLYIYEKHFIHSELPEYSEFFCVNECDEEKLHKKIEECDEVYLYDLSAQKRNDMMKICFYNHKPVYFTCKLSDMELRSAAIAQDGDKLIFFKETNAVHGISRFFKRFVDIAVSAVSIVLLSPVFGIIAAAIKLEDGGKVFYRQTRCTKNQREFQIIKFRSMVAGAEEHVGARLAEKRDSRLTRVGYYLRKSKLDELPQLINILKGDMSIVGPRPERPELIAKTIESVPEFSFRTTVKAGLTGYAQVHGDYHTDFLEKLKWDLMYIENFSLLLDFKIILMTIPVLFRGSDDV